MPGGSKQIAKAAITADIGLATDKKRERRCHIVAQDINRSSQTPGVHGTVESGAAFVMQHRHALRVEKTPDLRQTDLHLLWAHAPRGTGDADCVKNPDMRQLRLG